MTIALFRRVSYTALLVAVMASLGVTMAAEAASRHVRAASAAECDWRRITLLDTPAYVGTTACGATAQRGR